MPKFDWGVASLFVFVFLISGIGACSEDAPVSLSRADNKILDSIFFSKKDSIIKLTDSICEERYDKILSTAIDSIKRIRREEIESILNRR